MVQTYRTAEPKPLIRSMAEDLGVLHEALRTCIRQADADGPVRAGVHPRRDLVDADEDRVRQRLSRTAGAPQTHGSDASVVDWMMCPERPQGSG